MRVGGTIWSRRDARVMIASIVPLAAMVWPIMLLVDETGTRAAWVPRARLMPAASVASLATVALPWALM